LGTDGLDTYMIWPLAGSYNKLGIELQHN
jgi:uncharacterized membrane protein